jgi:hypothetical protein
MDNLYVPPFDNDGIDNHTSKEQYQKSSGNSHFTMAGTTKKQTPTTNT